MAVAIALGAIALVTALALVAVRSDVDRLATTTQRSEATAIVGAIRYAYIENALSWSGARLRAAGVLAVDSRAALRLVDAAGHPVAIPSLLPAGERPALHGPARSVPIVVSGTRVGTATIHFYDAALPAAEAQLRNSLVGGVGLAAGIAALVALAVAVLLSRRITGPVAALLGAVRAMERGERDRRVGRVRAAGELGELARAFDQMTATVARQEELRRAVVADVAHELRTPLAIMQASTEALCEQTIPPSPEELASLHEEVLRLAHIVADLDALAAAEAATVQLRLRSLDVSEPVARAVESMRWSYREAGVELLEDLRPAPARADEDRLVQLVTNLLANALKFTPRGGQVSVQVRRAAGAAQVAVADSGIGISAEELPHIFERFWRGSQAGDAAGSGIGLAIVEAIARAHGATIGVESQPGTGTSFTLTFPRF